MNMRVIMNLPKTILVPIDFSAGSEAALDYAVALASKLDARVHLLNVVSLQMLGGAHGAAIAPGVVSDIFDGNQKELDQLVAARKHACPFGPTILDTGDAATQIEDQASKVQADLIVMGTHGRQG